MRLRTALECRQRTVGAEGLLRGRRGRKTRGRSGHSRRGSRGRGRHARPGCRGHPSAATRRRDPTFLTTAATVIARGATPTTGRQTAWTVRETAAATGTTRRRQTTSTTLSTTRRRHGNRSNRATSRRNVSGGSPNFASNRPTTRTILMIRMLQICRWNIHNRRYIRIPHGVIPLTIFRHLLLPLECLCPPTPAPATLQDLHLCRIGATTCRRHGHDHDEVKISSTRGPTSTLTALVPVILPVAGMPLVSSSSSPLTPGPRCCVLYSAFTRYYKLRRHLQFITLQRNNLDILHFWCIVALTVCKSQCNGGRLSGRAGVWGVCPGEPVKSGGTYPGEGVCPDTWSSCSISSDLGPPKT